MIFSKDKIEEIKSRSSIAELAKDLTDLKPSGANLVGLSPFQAEKTPSFYIYDGDRRYKCFSSGKSGSVFDFVMETRGLSFPEAVTFLAEKAGISLEGESQKKNLQAQKIQELNTVLEIAAKEYEQVLSNTKHAKAYIKERGMSAELCSTFGLGFAPDSWNYIFEHTAEKVAASLKLDPSRVRDIFLSAGLLKKKDDSGYYDAFRSRIIFPIRSKDGKYIALGGRILEKDATGPKYLNSSENLVYEKRSVLYGLHEGLDSIRRSKHAFIVEGYFDVLSMVQKGFKDVVASCGTAFGSDHASQISKLVNKATVIFDGDSAGRKAASRCFDAFINSGLECYAVLLPTGEDPDSICRANNASKIEQIYLDNRVLLFDFYVMSIVEELGSEVPDLQSLTKTEPSKKGEAAKRALKTLTKVINPVERESFINRLSEVLDVKLSSVRELFHTETSTQQKNSKLYRSARVEEVIASEEKQEVNHKQVVLTQSLEIYLRQLIVSVLCEPSIISTIITSVSFFDEGLLPEHISRRIKDFFAELSERGFAGLSIEDETTTRTQHNLAVLCLEKFNFPPKAYLQESYRQLQMGGAAPLVFAEQLESVSTRLTLKSELEVIRQKEGNEQDISQLEKLAQEKLLKKRELKGKTINA